MCLHHQQRGFLRMLPRTTEVLIVGAGPSGLALATALKLLDVDVTIIDRQAHGANTSRAAVIHARTLEVLETLSVTSALLERGIIVPTFRIRDRDRVLLDIDFGQLASRYPFTLMCPQDQTEKVLLERFEDLGGRVCWSTEFVRMETHGNDVIIQLRRTSGESTMVAKWVAGCDGAHSVVREDSGIGFMGGTYAEDFVLADVAMRWPLARDEVDLFLAPDGLVVVAPLPQDRFRIVATVSQAPEKPDVAFMQALLSQRGPSDDPGCISDIVWSSRFRIHHRVAATPLAERIVLCGDAAHVHSPAGGQGMNTGIQDAISLAGPLYSALHGDSAELIAWAARRHEVATAVVSLTDRMTRAATLKSKPARMGRNLLLTAANRIPSLRRRIARRIAELDN